MRERRREEKINSNWKIDTHKQLILSLLGNHFCQPNAGSIQIDQKISQANEPKQGTIFIKATALNEKWRKKLNKKWS